MIDKGAHFHRCDFQVHTPRDLNWKGSRPSSAEERRVFAAEFVSACREKRLDAVAITDHHDMEFVEFIREAAAKEKDADGELLPKDARLVVFPGMELTLSVPCQAIIIFDSTLPGDLFGLAQHSLAITPNGPDKDVTAPTERLDYDLQELHEALDKHEYLHGRYIVLPNVSEGGTSTLLRSGHAIHYCQMRCVGGYLDGKWEKLGKGNVGILTGRNAEYGHKALGVFQTSDNRRADFTNLGKATTWVKWAEGTAEALRQACLARESRISQQSPRLPSSFVASIEVSNSSFMGPFVLQFNRQYNAIIGGRGTGKSTILEYLRWALCDDPMPGSLPQDQERRRDLVTNTLKPLSGSVRVTVVVNDVPHIVRRDADTGEVRLKVGTAEFADSNPSEIHRLLPIQAYSQKQLSNVAVRLEELERFLHSPIKPQLVEIEGRFSEIAGEIREAFLNLQQQRQLTADIEAKEREAQSIEAQVEQLRSALTGLDDLDRSVLASLNDYSREKETIDKWSIEVKEAQEAIEELKVSIQSASTSDDDVNDELAGLPNSEVVAQLRRAHAKLFQDLNTQVTQIERLVNDAAEEQSGSDYSVLVERIDSLHAAFSKRYQAAKAKSSTQETQLEELEDKEQKLALIRREHQDRKRQLERLGTPADTFSSLKESWYALHRERTALIQEQCADLTNLSSRQIRVKLRPAALVDPVREAFTTALAGANILGAKIEKLFREIEGSSDPLNAMDDALGELERLAVDADQPGYRPVTPRLDTAGFKSAELDRIARKLSPEAWLEVLLIPIGDRPVFEYRVRDDEYIPFQAASAGQQATALLWTLLSQDGPPLVIDQPEDDLDNPIIAEVVEHIWDAKQRRQLVFASHNANIVVNGDAELVVACANRVADEQAGGAIVAEGAIDMADVRDRITNVMEGGEQAFLLRRDKYGF